LVSCDAFSGSGIVSRVLKRHSDVIWTNDLEDYATIISKAFLTNQNDIDLKELEQIVDEVNSLAIANNRPNGFIAELYAPANDLDIKEGERVFYTSENAKKLDAYAQLIKNVKPELQNLLYGPLLSAASIHANTGGVFKGFYKDPTTGKGKFGGGGADAPGAVGGAGGKGVVILSVPTSSYSSTTTGSPTISTSGSNTIMVFNGSGSYTA
jgi:adenine-specific DNA-methyltransferase